jgi:hypothetical protein
MLFRKIARKLAELNLMKAVLFLVPLFFSFFGEYKFAFASSQTNEVEQLVKFSKEKKLHEKRQWRLLLHFFKDSLSSSSEIDGPNFFISESGIDDPRIELQETLTRVLTTVDKEKEEDRYQCRYPARNLWLKDQLQEQWKILTGKAWPTAECSKLSKWFNALNGPSVSLVFSSYYLNNPSSAFGHTFLRINKEANQKSGMRFELLDYGINFAATIPNNENPILYAYRGLAGSYPGQFSTMPYYYKVREYNNAESRDLWEYELNLTPKQVEMMTLHLWELGSTYISYYYLTKNCSYQILALVEVANPELRVVEKMNKFVIPSDTVLVAMAEPGLVRSYKTRPSIRTEFFSRLNKLNEKEKKEVQKIYKNKKTSKSLKNFSQTVQSKILDTVADHIDFSHPIEVQNKESAEAQFKNSILSERSQIDLISETVVPIFSYEDQPHISHPSRRFGSGFLASEKESWFLFKYKFSLHDQLDPVGGYPDYSEMYFGELHFSYSDLKRKIELEKFTLIEVLSHSPLIDFSKNISWRVRLGVERLKWQDCYNCHAPLVGGGPSLTWFLDEKSKLTVNLGLKGTIYTTPSAPANKLFLSLGPETRLRYRWSNQIISMIESYFVKDQFRENASENNETTFSTQWTYQKNQAAKAVMKTNNVEQVGGIDWYYYF